MPNKRNKRKTKKYHKNNSPQQPTRNQSANKEKADENLEEEECNICDSPHHNTIDHCTVEYVEDAHKVLMYLKDYCHFCEKSGHDLYSCETFTKAQKEQQEYQQWLEVHSNNNNNAIVPKDKKENDCFKKSFTYCPYCEDYGHNPYDCTLVNAPFNNKKDDVPFKKVYFPMNQKSVYLSSDRKFLRVCTVHCVCQMCHTKYSSKLNKKAVENNSTNTGSDDDGIRYCFICGANGLMDSCVWKKTGSA